jgi:hypothetical protein
MAEQYQNFAYGTATASLGTANPLTIVLNGGAGAAFPTTTNGPFRITVQEPGLNTVTEVMIVTTRATDTLTAYRGTAIATYGAAEVPTPTISTWAAGAIVSHNFTAGVMNQIRSEIVKSGTSAGLPGTSTTSAGSIYLPTDGVSIAEFGTSSLGWWGPVYPCVAPIGSNFSWQNQSSGTSYVGSVDEWNGGLTLSQTTPASGASTGNVSCLSNTSIGANFTATFGFNAFCLNSGGFVGPYVTNGTALIIFGLQSQASSGQHAIRISLFTNVNSYNSDYYGPTSIVTGLLIPTAPAFFRIQENGTNRIYSISTDLRNWWTLFSHAQTTGLTTTGYGVSVQSRSGASDSQVLTLFHYKQTTP